MAKKILYLGEGKWCYTPNCSEHSKLTELQNKWATATKENRKEEAQALAETLKTLPGGEGSLKQAMAELLKEKLGRTPVIGLDFDGTSVDTENGFRAYLKETLYGTQTVSREELLAQFPELTTYEFHANDGTGWFATEEEFRETFIEAEEDGLYRKAVPYPAAPETLRELSDLGFQIRPVTARPAKYHEDGVYWTKTASIPQKGIRHFGHEKEKATDVDAYIDDSPEVIHRLLGFNKKVLVHRQNYNEKEQFQGTFDRIKDWNDNVFYKIVNLLNN